MGLVSHSRRRKHEQRPDAGFQGVSSWLGIAIAAALVIAFFTLYLAGGWRNGDVSLYHSYALGFWGGLPHPLLPTEYPPLAIIPFTLTLAGPAPWYPDVFAFWMIVIASGGYLAFRRWTTPRQGDAYGLYLLSAGIATLLFRYDIVPALAVVSAVWLAERGRFAAAYPILAAATLMKLFPAVVLPILAIAHWHAAATAGRNRWLSVAFGAGSFAALVVLGFAVAAAFDPRGWPSSLLVELQRPVEVEAVPATVLWFASFIGAPVHAIVTFDSFNLESALSTLVTVGATVVLATGLIYTYWRQGLRSLSLGQATASCFLVLLCTSKVLSSQYFLWVAPFIAYTCGFRLRWFLLFLLTALIFPTLWGAGVDVHGAGVSYAPWFLAVIAARNLLLVVLAGLYLKRPCAEGQRAPPEATGLDSAGARAPA